MGVLLGESEETLATVLLGAVGRVKDGHRCVWARDLPLRRQSHSAHVVRLLLLPLLL